MINFLSDSYKNRTYVVYFMICNRIIQYIKQIQGYVHTKIKTFGEKKGHAKIKTYEHISVSISF